MINNKTAKKIIYAIIDVFKSLPWIVLITLVVGFASYVIKNETFVPQYYTSATYAVKTRESNANPYTNLQSFQNLASIYNTVLNSDELKQIVLNKTGWKTLPGSLSTSIIEGTNIIEIKTYASNPRDAFLFLSAVCESYPIIMNKVAEEAMMIELSPVRVPMFCSNTSGAKDFAIQMSLYAFFISIIFCAYFSVTKKVLCTSSDISEKINAQLIEAIPSESISGSLKTKINNLIKKKKEIILLNSSSNYFSESIYGIRAKMLSSLTGQGYSFVVTSTLPNEGKSTISASLAMSMIKTNKKVALLDLDIYNTSQRNYFSNFEGYNKMGDFLKYSSIDSNDIKISENGLSVFYDTQIGKEYKEFPVKYVTKFITSLKEFFDIIIIDTPPLSIFTDAAEICDVCDACALVVREHYATEDEISDSISMINESKSVLLGCIYNREIMSRKHISGSYYGSYGYGSYANHYNYKDSDEEEVEDE